MKLSNNPDVALQQEDPPRSTGCFPEPSGMFTRHVSVNYEGCWEEEGTFSAWLGVDLCNPNSWVVSTRRGSGIQDYLKSRGKKKPQSRNKIRV